MSRSIAVHTVMVVLLVATALGGCSDDAPASTTVDTTGDGPAGPEAPPGAGIASIPPETGDPGDPTSTTATGGAGSTTGDDRTPTTSDPTTTDPGNDPDTGGDPDTTDGDPGSSGSTAPPTTEGDGGGGGGNATTTTSGPDPTTGAGGGDAHVTVGGDRYEFTPEECSVFDEVSVLVEGPGLGPDGTPVYVFMDAEVDEELWGIHIEVGTDDPVEVTGESWVAGIGVDHPMEVTVDGTLVEAIATFEPGEGGDPADGELRVDCGDHLGG